MKKKISILIIAIIIILGILNTCLAVGEEANKSIELNLKGQTTVKESTKTVELIISLGNFTGIQENIVLGYQTELVYDQDMFTSVKVEGLNGWTATYEESTKMLVGEIATPTAKANTDITKIILTLKDGIIPGTTGKFKLNNLILSDGTNDFTFNKEATIAIEKKIEEGSNKVNTNTNEKTEVTDKTTSKKGKNTDTTTASTNIPATGTGMMIVVVIFILSIIGLVSGKSYITYLKDTNKQLKK